jgi:hypothetical protein
MPHPERLIKVRKSMATIKRVVFERRVLAKVFLFFIFRKWQKKNLKKI